MSQRTIVVADDHAGLRMLIRTLLTRADDWTVLEAEDGDEALVRCRTATVDMVVVDQRMPGRTGTDVAGELRREGFQGPILLFTAYMDAEVEDLAERLRLIVLAKSDIDRLVAIARRHLGA